MFSQGERNLQRRERADPSGSSIVLRPFGRERAALVAVRSRRRPDPPRPFKLLPCIATLQPRARSACPLQEAAEDLILLVLSNSSHVLRSFSRERAALVRCKKPPKT